ncbi:MAG TPA: amidohydrolase family protein [Candidatus Binatia bacterium]|nr:amidohydrolase family protein [Candidatus Binatia bacterium]
MKNLALFFIFAASVAQAQETPAAALQSSIVLEAAKILDVGKGAYIENAAVWIEGERIKEVGRAGDVLPHAPKDAKIIDLGRSTVLPGLIDCHTHIMARIPEGDNGYIVNLATKSQAFRALEGAYNARITLEAGFTSIRDVENEGSGYADVALRDAINQGLAEGPRMQVATRAIAAVGQYNPFGVSPDLGDFPTGAQMVSGVDEARRAAREQIGHGADLIKVYADWDHPTLTVDEIRVIVEEAHKARRKVAAHAHTPDGIRNALNAGVDSIEHGNGLDRSLLQLMKEKNAYWVLTKGYYFDHVKTEKNPRVRAYFEKTLQRARENVATARELGVKIADGFDPAAAEEHGKNADEIVAMASLGMTPVEAIRAATVNAADLMGWQDRVGSIDPNKYADLIAVDGDPLADVTVLQNVKFVMKGGAVVKEPH